MTVTVERNLTKLYLRQTKPFDPFKNRSSGGRWILFRFWKRRSNSKTFVNSARIIYECHQFQIRFRNENFENQNEKEVIISLKVLNFFVYQKNLICCSALYRKLRNNGGVNFGLNWDNWKSFIYIGV